MLSIVPLCAQFNTFSGWNRSECKITKSRFDLRKNNLFESMATFATHKLLAGIQPFSSDLKDKHMLVKMISYSYVHSADQILSQTHACPDGFPLTSNVV